MALIYFNFFAILFVSIIFAGALLLNLKMEHRFERASKLTFVFVFVITLIFLVYALKDLNNTEILGKQLSFIILSNVYSGIIKIIALFMEKKDRREK
ncbi:MAG TPA: hypothetical protein PLO89_05940 [Spirochaetota bacterium]|nr:hypothetical protein [Spirochaetota bacterium]